MVESERIEKNKTIYKEKGKTITVIREFSKGTAVDFTTVIDALLDIIQQEEKDKNANEE